MGIEYDLSLVEKAKTYCKCGNNGELHIDRLLILHENVLDVDFSEASALFIYLVPVGMKAIRYDDVIMSLYCCHVSNACICYVQCTAGIN